MDQGRGSVKLSLVLPVFNEAENLRAFFEELLANLDSLEMELEAIFVNDGSRDASLEVMRELKDEFGARVVIVILDLARNFGHPAAVTAGIEQATGDAVLLMDTDMQDDPAAIRKMVTKWKDGADVVYATRTTRKEPLPLRMLFHAYHRLFSTITPIKVPPAAGNFGLIDRRVADEIRHLPEHNRYFPGLRAWVGFRQEGLEVPRRARSVGPSRVGLAGLTELALDGLLGFSALPLRLAFAAAIVLAFAALVGIAAIFFIKIFTDMAVPMWSSIMTVVLFSSSVQFFLIGLLGEYVARIYSEVKHRPHFIVRKRY